MQTPLTTSSSITKANLLRKYQSTKPGLSPRHPLATDFRLNLHSMPIASEKQKELLKMQSIFNGFIDDMNKKRDRERNKRTLTLEELSAKRSKELQSMNPSIQLIQHEEQLLESQRFEQLQSKKVFEGIKQAQKVSGIVHKTKTRISNKQFSKEQRFQQKFDLFKQMDSYLEVKDLLQRLHNLDESSLNDSKTNSRLFESRQNKMAAILEGIENEQAGNEQDEEYQEMVIRSTELMKKVGGHLKSHASSFHKASNERLMNEELISVISKELNSHLETARYVSVDGENDFHSKDAFITEMLNTNLVLTKDELRQKTKKPKVKKTKPVSAKGFIPQIVNPEDQPPAEEIYKEFKEKSQKIMNFLINQSKQIYRKKLALPDDGSSTKRRSNRLVSRELEKRHIASRSSSKHRKKTTSVPEFKRHETQKKSSFFMQKSVKNLPKKAKESPKANNKLLALNRNVNLLQREHSELLELPQLKFKDLKQVMSLKQQAYDATVKLPLLHTKSKSEMFKAVFIQDGPLTCQEKALDARIQRSMSMAKQYMDPKVLTKPKGRSKKPSIVSIPETKEPLLRRSPSPDPSIASDQSGSQGSFSHSNKSEQQRYRTNKVVKLQRRVIQLLLEKIDQTKETLVRDKKSYSKRIDEIQTNYDNDLQRFKPESIESLKYVEVNRNKMLDVRKHTFKRKLR